MYCLVLPRIPHGSRALHPTPSTLWIDPWKQARTQRIRLKVAIDISMRKAAMEDGNLESSLVAIVKELFSGPDRAQLSVNNVRKQCEERHGLEDGFFNSAEWKTRSKLIIKNKVVC